ncbi:MAG: CCA tRNA nucleotidyltransferase [Limisphaerales bacterium]
MNESLPQDLKVILTEAPKLSRAYLVGGCVRDWLLGQANKDYDIEVFGLDYEALANALSRWGKVDLVGRSFGVIKLTTSARHTYDFSIPRRDSKNAPGHKGFQVTFDPSLTPEDAAGRRDFTINAMMFDPRERSLLDPFHGEADLRAKILRHTSAAFPEDPLRVLRGMQFAARFDLKPAAETVELSRSIKFTYPELARERVREEWFKWAEKSVKPSRGLEFLLASEWIEHFPELNEMRGVPQDPEWHPEGDVFIHTAHCCDAMAALPEWKNSNSETRIVYMLAVLTHDTGKAITTVEAMKRGELRIISPGHEEAGGDLAESFMERINAPRAIRERVVPLVVNHMAHFQTVSDRAVRRLAKRLEPENIQGLVTLMTADSFGRPPLPPEIPASVRAIAEKADELAVRKQPPEPILLGRHLLEFGFAPGKALGQALHAAYEAQLTGDFVDLHGALNWVRVNSKIPEEVRSAIQRRAGSED